MTHINFFHNTRIDVCLIFFFMWSTWRRFCHIRPCVFFCCIIMVVFFWSDQGEFFVPYANDNFFSSQQNDKFFFQHIQTNNTFFATPRLFCIRPQWLFFTSHDMLFFFVSSNRNDCVFMISSKCSYFFFRCDKTSAEWYHIVIIF